MRRLLPVLLRHFTSGTFSCSAQAAEANRSLTCVSTILDHRLITVLVRTGAWTKYTFRSGQAGLSCEDNTQRAEQTFTRLRQVCHGAARILACTSCQLCLDVLCDLILLCAACSKEPASLCVQESQHTPPWCLQSCNGGLHAACWARCQLAETRATRAVAPC